MCFAESSTKHVKRYGRRKMSRVECPSAAWDRHITGEEAAADAAMVVEREVLEKVEDAGYLAALSDRYELDVDPEGIFSDIIQVAYSKGYSRAIEDRKDGQVQYEAEQEQRRAGKEYVVVPYLRIGEGDYEPMSYEDALKEQEHFELMQPENVYRVEEVESGSNKDRE
jgi:hypothetical protein